MYEELVIKNVSEFASAVSGLNRQIKNSGGMDCSLLFRGQSNDKNILLPSIGRHSSGMIGESFLREEKNMVDMARYKLPDIFPGSLQPIDLLALLQHHGIPTRLLDISENALVALFFACSNEADLDQDGEVLIFSHKTQDIENYPMINAIADSYRFIRKEKTPLTFFYEQIRKQPYFADQAEETETGSVLDGARWVSECCKDVMIIYAKSYGIRQRIQRGRYILFPNTICCAEDGTEYFEQSITAIGKKHKAIIGRCIIPADCKKAILEELRLFGITRDMLFLDNVDITCKEIAERVKDSGI